MLLVEIHKPENFKLNFSRSFLQIIVEIGKKYALNPLFNILEAQLASKIEKCYPPVVNVIFKLRLDFYAYYDKNALNIPICALFYRLAVKLTEKTRKLKKCGSRPPKLCYPRIMSHSGGQVSGYDTPI